MTKLSYVEIAVGSPRNRGGLVAKDKLKEYINSTQAVYRSVYVYDEKAIEYVEKNGTLRSYFGVRDIDKVVIDVDKLAEDSDDFTLDKARSVLLDLEEYGLDEDHIQPFFSGTGYHLLLNASVFGFEKGEDLPFIVKQTILGMFDSIDPSIYMRSGIYRLPHTINYKTGLYKIPLSVREFLNLKSNEIHRLAKTQRLDFEYHGLSGNKELAHKIVTEIPAVPSMRKIAEPDKIATCIHRIYKKGPTEGTRHNEILRLVSHFRRHGIPSDGTKSAILAWNNGSLDKMAVLEKVENVYNSGYRYGCNDDLLKKYCSSRCIYFKRKDYLIDVKSAQDMQKELEERMTTDFSGKIIDLGKHLDLPETIDSIVYPGELLTVFGPTGSSKTTLVQNIALGYNSGKDIIDKKLQIPTLYLSLELSSWYMHRRNLQIVSNRSKPSVIKDYKEIYKQYEDELQHIVVQTVAPNLNQIREKITELQPALVIVDYIDLIGTPYRDEYQQIKYVSHNLRNIAVNNDIIIIQVSQVSRDYSRREALDLYAGKGSGAIENASSKVLGIRGKADEAEKELEMFKNSDGDLFTAKVTWTPSFRLRRI